VYPLDASPRPFPTPYAPPCASAGTLGTQGRGKGGARKGGAVASAVGAAAPGEGGGGWGRVGVVDNMLAMVYCLFNCNERMARVAQHGDTAKRAKLAKTS
jgi:hypothetical protein